MKEKEVRDLYENGFAAREVAGKLGVSIDRVYKLMRKKHIPRRSPVEANRIAYSKKEASFRLVFIENKEQESLKLAGVMLYWAEGTKLGATVDFANSDERMISIFLKFLRNICCVDEKKLRAYLYCYPQQDVNFLVDYWAELTGIPRARFIKPYVRRDATGKTDHRMKYGLIHLRYHDKKLMVQLLKWIDEYCRKFREGYPSGQRG